MSIVHSYSSPTIRSDVDLFSVPSTCTTVEDSFYAEYKPVVNVQDSNAKLEFRIPGSHHYVDLNDHFLYIRAKIVDKSGKDLTSTDEYSCSNYLLHTMFSQADVFVNNNQITTNSNNCYGYKAYIQSTLSYGADYFMSQAPCALYYRDKPGTGIANLGYKSRKTYVENSKEFELCDRLKLDIAHQNRYILNETDISVVLTRATDEFCLMYTKPTASGTTPAADPKNPKLKILDASLYVRKKILYPSISLAHQKLMSEGETAKYPLKHTAIKYFTLPSGNQSFVEENVFLGKIPSRVVIGLLPNSSFNGSYESNPFWFDHENVSLISISVNNSPVPIKPLTVDMKDNHYLIPYFMTFSSTGNAGQDFGFQITRDDYIKGGYYLYPFDLRPILGSESTLHLEKSGSVRIELKFSKALAQATTLIVYAEEQGIIEIDQYRQVSIQ
jgi:hypothetical protein